jgi:hypothetical protein
LKLLKPTIFAAIYMLFAGPAAAQSCEQQIMSCTLRGGTKTLQVCLNGPDAVYRYGPTGGAPELELTAPVATVEYVPWPGMGRDIWETVTFANGPYRYAVATGFSRTAEDADAVPSNTYGGVTITRDGTGVAELQCDAGSVNWAYGGGLYEAKTASGLCWTGYPDETWTTLGPPR